MKFSNSILSALAVGIISACGQSPTPDEIDPSPANQEAVVEWSVETEDAYVRAPLAGRDVSAGFFRIRSVGADAKILSASVEGVDTTELHTHEHSDGQMKMRQVTSVDLPDGEWIEFKPMGLHLMLFGVDPSFATEGTREMVLTIETDGASTKHSFVAEVRELGASE